MEKSMIDDPEILSQRGLQYIDELKPFEAAFNHKISEEDIRWAFFHYLYDGPIDNFENKYVRIGFNRIGNLLEIMYNEIDDHTVNIFHAMDCRAIYYHLINR